MRTLIPIVIILSLIPFSLFASARSDSGGLPERVAELEAQVGVLAAALQEAQEILQYVRVETEEINGLAGPLHGLANQEVLRWIQAVYDKLGGKVPTKDELLGAIQSHTGR